MDFYTLLGVTRTASAADVERAYRRLARRYHPGVNPGDRDAERLYQQVQEAYVVLGDAERRREYDRGAVRPDEPPVAFEGFDFSAPAEGPLAATFSELFSDVFQQAAREAVAPTRGSDIAVDVHLSFEEAVRGGQVPISVGRHDRCTTCRGRGHAVRGMGVCPACRGEGSRRWARGHMVFAKTCEVCGGDGQTIREACRTCSGSGVAPRTDVVTLSIPAGLESGARLAVPGRGHAGALGGPAGDLYVTVSVAAHRVLTRRGADLHLTLPVAVHEAGLGALVDVPGLDGRLSVRIPPGTTSGSVLLVRGEGGVRPGTGERGDLVITVQVALPDALDDRSRELLREFGERNGTDVRRHLFQHE